jgi:hypothetical protein
LLVLFFFSLLIIRFFQRFAPPKAADAAIPGWTLGDSAVTKKDSYYESLEQTCTFHLIT